MVKKISSKNKQKDKINKIITIFKKANEHEKMKSEAKKAEKKNRIRGYRARRFGVFSFWFLFIIMLCVFLVNTVSTNGETNTSEVEFQMNKATSEEAVEFSKDFLQKYFTWIDVGAYDSDAKEKRKALMSRYLPNELVNIVADTTSPIWNSELKKENILLKNIEDVGDNQARITFKINPIFTKTAGAIEEEKKAVEESEIVKLIRKVKFLAIKLYYDEVNESFIVYELPSFTYVEEADNPSNFLSETDGLKKDDSETKEIKSFLETFFDSYINDSKEKLAYLFENPENITGLNQTMEFVKFNNLAVFEGQNESEKVVSTDVTLKEPDTSVPFVATYTLVVKRTEQGYVVKHLENKAYLDQLRNSKDGE